MVVLLDTSAVLALADRRDPCHDRARAERERLDAEREPLLVTTYVLVECFSLLDRRHGRKIATRVCRDLRNLELAVVDGALHDRGVAWISAHRRARVSLVDAVSFVVMEERGIGTAFAFDADFARAGFRAVPRPEG